MFYKPKKANDVCSRLLFAIFLSCPDLEQSCLCFSISNSNPQGLAQKRAKLRDRKITDILSRDGRVGIG
jgi:hypothetical protein